MKLEQNYKTYIIKYIQEYKSNFTGPSGFWGPKLPAVKSPEKTKRSGAYITKVIDEWCNAA